jgi:hypothetical protein
VPSRPSGTSLRVPIIRRGERCGGSGSATNLHAFLEFYANKKKVINKQNVYFIISKEKSEKICLDAIDRDGISWNVIFLLY